MKTSQASEEILPIWRRDAKREGVFDKYIHEVEDLFSGSKVSIEQFLAFRVLWTGHGSSDTPRSVKHELMEKCITEAAKCLKANRSWSLYCKALGHEEPWKGTDTGMFTLLMDWHNDVLRLPMKTQNDNAKYQSTPWNKRLRSADKIGSKIKQPDFRMAKATTASITQGMEDMSFDDYGDSVIVTPSKTEQPETLNAPTPQDPYSLYAIGEAINFPSSQDEQIVNAALLNLPKGLTITVPIHGLICNWTISRLQLQFQFNGRKLFEARTDGYLMDGKGHAKALVEVKAGGRSFKVDEIRRQESAQMITFIQEEDMRAPFVGEGKHK